MHFCNEKTVFEFCTQIFLDVLQCWSRVLNILNLTLLSKLQVHFLFFDINVLSRDWFLQNIYKIRSHTYMIIRLQRTENMDSVNYCHIRMWFILVSPPYSMFQIFTIRFAHHYSSAHAILLSLTNSKIYNYFYSKSAIRRSI